MGSSSSKATRTLSRTSPSLRTQPPWAGARTPDTAVDSSQSSYVPPAVRHNITSEEKTEDIERDGKDPQLVNNLYRLGQVRSSQTVDEKATHVAQMYNSLKESENQASAVRLPRNRLQVVALAGLLDERKAVRSESELARLASRYNVDLEVVRRLARHVNTPSVADQSTAGPKQLSILALWEEPKLQQE